ncbi:putative reverse transcriptase domain-containing protein [Tanacetum coccineum]|uniref:Reverse transcriptase domain-containing protein n=1 Tax=Tanacetum coccineum TaxID=301880 RepID=A0ABQ5E074_9ASTR
MVNVIPPDHVDDVPVVEPNQHDDVPVVPEHVLVDEDEDPEEDEFEEEEYPQEEEDYIEVDIEEDDNEPELSYPYEEVDHLNPSPPAFESELEDVIEISRRLCGLETMHALVDKKGKAKDKYYGFLIIAGILKDGGEGHTRNRCPKKIKQEESGQVRGRAYAIKDDEPQGPNVVTGTFLFNNRYAFILFDLGSVRSFVHTRFSSMLDIDPVKIGASYEVELADGRVVSTNTVLKGCTLNLVNHVFEIDLMPIELGTFDVIISMDWLVKHDAVIVYGEKVVRIPYGNKMLIVESDKGVSRLKVISCIKALKYVERGFHLFLAHVTENKSKEKRLEDMPIIHDFPKVFPEDLPGLPPSRQVEFRIGLVQGAAPVAHPPYRLAPSKMRELLVQLQELLEKGFIRLSSSPW